MTRSPLHQVITRLLRLLPVAWRGPAFGLFTTRPWGFIGIIVLVGIGVSALNFGEWGTLITQAYYLVGLALPLAITKGMIGGDRSAGRWAVLFQRPGRVEAHYARVSALAFGILLACWVVVCGVLVVGGLVRGSAITPLLGCVLGGFVWAVMSFCVGVALTALSRAQDSEFAVLYIVFGGLQGVIARFLHLTPTLATALGFVLIPFNGVGVLWIRLAGGADRFEVVWIVQMFTFPVLMALVVAWQLRRLARQDLTDLAPG
jgi:hypothetical protein